MKGLKEYISKHGRHFTEKLAIAVMDSKWSSSEIERSSETMVYYNVSEATLGDIVFLVNKYKKNHCRATKKKCLKYALDIVGDYSSNGYAFTLFSLMNSSIDLKEYI